jgi:hypothetical protein
VLGLRRIRIKSQERTGKYLNCPHQGKRSGRTAVFSKGGIMTALAVALSYAARGWPVFPCSARKTPMIEDWAAVATTDPATVTACWELQVPHALIGIPTGERTGLAVLDIDMKGGRNGLRTLAKLLDCPILPAAPTVQTPTGGFHLHFRRPKGGLPCTAGAGGRGIGEGLDWRGDGGYVILPSPGSGYSWGVLNYDNCDLCLPPDELLPRQKPADLNFFRKLRLSTGPSQGSLAGVFRRLHAATPGERNRLLFWAACRFAEAVHADVIGEEGARSLLHQGGAAIGLTDHEVTKTIDSAFAGRGR